MVICWLFGRLGCWPAVPQAFELYREGMVASDERKLRGEGFVVVSGRFVR